MNKSEKFILSLVTVACTVVFSLNAQAKIAAAVKENFQDAEKVKTEWELNKRNVKWVDGKFIVAELAGATMKAALPDSFTLTLEVTPHPPKNEKNAKEGWTGISIGSTIFMVAPSHKNSARAAYKDEDGKSRSAGLVKGVTMDEIAPGQVMKFTVIRKRNLEDKADAYTFSVNGKECKKFETAVPEPKNDRLQFTSFRWSSQYNNLEITPAAR